MRRILATVLTLAVLALPAAAAEPAKRPEPGTTVEMPFLIAPMSQDGKLLGYAYITSKLVCSSPSACIDVREKLAFIQDANVRDVNAHPIATANDPTAVDHDLLNAHLTANAKRIVGDSKVVNMVFIDVKYAPLRPSESTAGQPVLPPDDPTTGKAASTAAAGSSAPAAQGQAATQSTATSKPPAKQAR
jgi:hypothetical protein